MERIVMSFLVELPEDQFNPEAFASGVPVAGFDMNTARAMAWISQLAYETRLPDKIERIAGSGNSTTSASCSSPPKVRFRSRARAACWRTKGMR